MQIKEWEERQIQESGSGQNCKNVMPHRALCMMLSLAGLETFSCMHFKCFDLYLMTGNLYMPLSRDGFVRGPAKSMHIH